MILWSELIKSPLCTFDSTSSLKIKISKRLYIFRFMAIGNVHVTCDRPICPIVCYRYQYFVYWEHWANEQMESIKPFRGILIRMRANYYTVLTNKYCISTTTNKQLINGAKLVIERNLSLPWNIIDKLNARNRISEYDMNLKCIRGWTCPRTSNRPMKVLIKWNMYYQ